MNLIDNGLRAHEDVRFGGWGGRREPGTGPNEMEKDDSSARFFAAAQREFAARLRWSVTPRFNDANHPPRLQVQGALQREARPGERITLAARASDPDGDRVRLHWWHYREAGTYTGAVVMADAEVARAHVTVPADAAPGSTIHLIAEATDAGEPALTRYQRVVVKVLPHKGLPAYRN
jgi:hypothetical protein